MRRNPLYAFKDSTSVGIFNVPLNSTIHILDAGQGLPMFVEIISKEGLTAGSSIADFLSRPELYIDLSNENEIPSELEKLEVNGKVGWRMLGRVQSNYGEIGNQAIDLSYSDQSGSVNGATGDNSFAEGYNVIASGTYSIAMGLGVQSIDLSEISLGRYNKLGADNYDPNNDGNFTEVYPVYRLLSIGMGNSDISRMNALEVYEDGIIRAPQAEYAEIFNGDKKTLVTKEYADIVDGGML